MIVPLSSLSIRSIENYSTTSGFNTGFMILNNETNNAEYYEINQFVSRKIVKIVIVQEIMQIILKIKIRIGWESQ